MKAIFLALTTRVSVLFPIMMLLGLDKPLVCLLERLPLDKLFSVVFLFLFLVYFVSALDESVWLEDCHQPIKHEGC